MLSRESTESKYSANIQVMKKLPKPNAIRQQERATNRNGLSSNLTRKQYRLLSSVHQEMTEIQSSSYTQEKKSYPLHHKIHIEHPIRRVIKATHLKYWTEI